ncbi:MAG: FGLLP motif-containing membrane protein [Acidimicrobiales bacterium]|nr:FGLLP motif-containing membrane protein [Acidimicrobiales bacterium]
MQPSTMRAGDAVTVSGCGFGANKSVTLNMFSTPVFLGQTTANGTGNYSMVAVIPADAAPGNHTIVASGQNGESVASEGSTGIFISGPPLDDNLGGGDPGTTIPNTTIPNTTVPNTTIPATSVPAATTIPGTTVPQAGGGTETPSEGSGSPGGGTGTGTGAGGTGTGTGTGAGGTGTGAGTGTDAGGAGRGTGIGAGGTGTGGLGTIGTGGALGPGTNPLGGAGSETTTGTVPGGTGGALNTPPAGGGGVALGPPGGGTPSAQAGAGAADDRSSGHSRTAPLQPRPGFEEQSELVTAVPTPADISTDPETIAANVLLAIALILLIGFPADIFNATLLDNYDEIRGWFRFGRRRREAAMARAEDWFDRLPTPLRLGTFGLMGSVLYGLLDPNFGFNRPSLILVLGLLLAIATISTVLDLLRVRYHHRVTRKHSRLKAYPLGLVMAAILVFFSRIGDFHPGYVFGVFTALAFEDELYDEEDGRGLAVAGVGLLVVALLALFLRGPVDQLAGANGASFYVLVIDAALATLWIAGIQAVIWGLIPIKFMYGQKVLAWSKWGWLAIYGTGMLLFVHTLLHPGMGLYGNAAEASLFSVTLLFLGFGAFSLCFWAYFRFRRPRPPKFEPVAGERTLVG